MNSLPHKTKQFLIVVAKLSIVGGAFYFIYDQLANNGKLDWLLFAEKFNKNKSVSGILFILFLSFLNRYLEILKWQNLAQIIDKISVKRATQQVLSALTAGIMTPNGIGEYAGKTLYFERSSAKRIVFLNLICNGIQMVWTVAFGVLGLLYFNATYNIITTKTVGILFGMCVTLFLVLFFLKGIKIKGYSIETLIHKINEIPKDIHRKNSLLGLGRFLVFAHQYYFLMLAFDVNLPYLLLMATILAVYFLASSLPTFQFLDFAVKGSIAVYFFGILGVNEWITVFVTTLMWFLNVVIPAIVGSYYVLKFKSSSNS